MTRLVKRPSGRSAPPNIAGGRDPARERVAVVGDRARVAEVGPGSRRRAPRSSRQCFAPLDAQLVARVERARAAVDVDDDVGGASVARRVAQRQRVLAPPVWRERPISCSSSPVEGRAREGGEVGVAERGGETAHARTRGTRSGRRRRVLVPVDERTQLAARPRRQIGVSTWPVALPLIHAMSSLGSSGRSPAPAAPALLSRSTSRSRWRSPNPCSRGRARCRAGPGRPGRRDIRAWPPAATRRQRPPSGGEARAGDGLVAVGLALLVELRRRRGEDPHAGRRQVDRGARAREERRLEVAPDRRDGDDVGGGRRGEEQRVALLSLIVARGGHERYLLRRRELELNDSAKHGSVEP